MGESSKASEVSPPALGFLTVIENEQLGLVGGYLILNASGRPQEFHCTAPVKPSRAQQILFGPTLAPYLYGEQIAQALVNKGTLTPLVVWTDQPSVLAVREFVTLPVALVAFQDNAIDEARRHFDAIEEFTVGKSRIVLNRNHAEDRAKIEDRMQTLGSFDLREPFDRIREAVEEAQRAAAGNRQAA